MSSHSPPSPEYSSSSMVPFSPSQNPSPFPSPLPSPQSTLSSSTPFTFPSNNTDLSVSEPVLSTSISSAPLASFAILPSSDSAPVSPPSRPPPPPVSTEASLPPLSFASGMSPPETSPVDLRLAVSEEGGTVTHQAPFSLMPQEFSSSQGGQTSAPSSSFAQPDLVLDISPSRFGSAPSPFPSRPPPQPVRSTSDEPTLDSVPQHVYSHQTSDSTEQSLTQSSTQQPTATASSEHISLSPPLSFANQPSPHDHDGRESAGSPAVISLSEFLGDSKPAPSGSASALPPSVLESSHTLPAPADFPARTISATSTTRQSQSESQPETSQVTQSKHLQQQQQQRQEILAAENSLSSPPEPFRKLSSSRPDLSRPGSQQYYKRSSMSSPHMLPEPSVFEANLPKMMIPTGKNFNELAVWKIYCAFRCVVQRRVLHALWVWKVTAAAHARNPRIRDMSPNGSRRPRSGTLGSGKHGRSPMNDDDSKRPMTHRMSTRRLESPLDPEAVFHFHGEGVQEGEGEEMTMPTEEEDLPVVQSNRRSPPKDKTPMPTRLVDYYTVFGLDSTVMKAAEAELATKSKAELPAVIEDINSRLSKELTPVVLARWPLNNYNKDYPLDPEWSGFGFPDGLSLYTDFRPVTMFYAVSTRSIGSHLCHAYLSCSKPLTIGEGKVVFVPVVFMLVSHYPQFEVLSRCLFEVYTLSVSKSKSSPQGIPVERLLVHLFQDIHVPPPGECCEFHFGSLTLRTVSSPRYMCSVFELAPLFSMLNADNIFVILAAILCECRILVTSSSRMSLTIACQALLQLLYPFQWHFSYVPVLSNNMLAAVSNFQPFLLGIHRSHLGQVDLEEVLLVDLDHNTVRCDTPQSVPKLPIKAGISLRKSLRECISIFVAARDQVNLHDSQEFTKSVYKAMLRFFAEILSGYRKFLFFIHDDPRFNSHGFRETRDSADDIFYERLVNSLAFNKYMERDYYPDPYHHCLAQPDIRGGGFQIESLVNSEFADPPTERVGAIGKEENKDAFKTPRGSLATGDLYEQIRIRPEFATGNALQLKVRTPPYEEKRPKFKPFEAGSAEERLKMFFEGVYDCINLRPSEIAGVKPLLAQASVRIALAEILIQPTLRTPSTTQPYSQPGTPLLCLTANSFTILSDVLLVALDECQKANDFPTATAILECAYEFYMEDKPGGNKIRMEAPLHKHPIWRNTAFWLESLNCILDTRKRLKAIHANKNHDPLSPKGEQASKFHVEWMIGAVDRMLEFGISGSQVKAVMHTLATRHHLTKEQDDTLTNFMDARLTATT